MKDEGLHEAERLAPAPPVPEAGGSVRSLIRLAAIDLGPLRRHRDYRLLFFGLGLSFFGSMLTYVAIPYHVYQLTGSPLLVGLLSLAELVPLLASALVGGALADAVDRRRMVQLTKLALMSCAGLLVVNALLSDPQVWLLFVVGSAMAGLDGFQRPSLDALTPRLVERHELMAASALDSLRFQVGMIAGPAVGGLLIASVGLPPDLRARRAHVRGLAGGARTHAGGAAPARVRAAKLELHRRGSATPGAGPSCSAPTAST